MSSEGPDALPTRLRRWWHVVSWAAGAYGLDPLDMMAVIDRESLGGEALTPKGPGGTGDGGHGRGLFQIDDRAHPTFCAALAPDGTPLWRLPKWNALYAAELLSGYVQEFGGSRLAAIAAYNCGPARVAKVLVAHAECCAGCDNHRSFVRALDGLTAGNNYLSDVLTRRERYEGMPSKAPT